MYKGVSNLSLDTKGRLAVPTRYRDPLLEHCSGEMVATIDIADKCLLLYPVPEWHELEAEIVAMPNFNEHARRIQRILLGHATDVQLDGNGRIQLPVPLREYAELDKKIVLVGQGKKFELWNEDLYRESREKWLVKPSGGDVPPELLTLSF